MPTVAWSPARPQTACCRRPSGRPPRGRWTAARRLEPPIPAVLVGQAARRPAPSVGDPFELSGLRPGFALPRRRRSCPSSRARARRKGTVIVPRGGHPGRGPDARLRGRTRSFVRASPALGAAMRERDRRALRCAERRPRLAGRRPRGAGGGSPRARHVDRLRCSRSSSRSRFAALVVAVAVVGDVAARHGEIALLRALGTRAATGARRHRRRAGHGRHHRRHSAGWRSAA